jgi:hypothetical protein
LSRSCGASAACLARNAAAPGDCTAWATDAALPQQLVDLAILVLPQLRQPALERHPERLVTGVVAGAEGGRNGHLAHAHDDAGRPAAQELPEGRRAAGVDDRGVHQRLETLAHRIEGQRQRAGLGLEQVPVR